MSGYDIVGDVHGDGTRLEALLRKMGYDGAYFAHPEGRELIFIGDLIDRGTEHAKTFDIVRRSGGRVLMGNHEFNALCFGTEGRNGPIRKHTPQNREQHGAFLAEYPHGSAAYREALDWFSGFPIFMDLGDIRLIHACWNDKALAACAPYMKKNSALKKKAALAAYDSPAPRGFRSALDILIKGPELRLPKGVSYADTMGHKRTKTRLYWWKNGDLKGEFFQHMHMLKADFSDIDLRKAQSLRNKFNYKSQNFVFFGHYNLSIDPCFESGRAVCVNFKNRLVAYRWNHGDRDIAADRLVFV